MAIAYDQNKTGSVGNSLTLELTFDTNPTAGDSIIAMVGISQEGVTASVADNNSDSYTEDEYYDSGSAAHSRPVYCWSSSAVTGGATTVTFTASALQDIHGCIVEVDQQIEKDVGNHTMDGSSTTSHSCGEITTLTNDTFIVTNSRCKADPGTETPETGYTEIAQTDRSFFQYRISSSTETVTGTWESTVSTRATSAHVAYKASGAPPGNAMPMAMNHYRRRRMC